MANSDKQHAFLGGPAYLDLLNRSSRDINEEAGGADAFGELTGYHKSSIARSIRKKKRDDPMRQQSITLFMLADLIASVDNPEELRTLQKLNDLAGLVGVPKPTSAVVGHGPGAVADLSGEFSDLIKVMSEALRNDGQITADEICNGNLVHLADRLAQVAATLSLRWSTRVEEAQETGECDE